VGAAARQPERVCEIDEAKEGDVGGAGSHRAQWGLLYAGQVRTAFCQDPLVHLRYGPMQYP
jgi:hypothetical protein